ncbi:MAG: hypothetical protein K0U70_03915 [Actinomycetia bacterium]|nr:hypothetical protein [Actinomycetes bacterium]MCH9710809.1 hypothetical protein [Actinomycetes bacterium]MCH9766926.1 hypothetical protein [Actinomycetes bacterium]
MLSTVSIPDVADGPLALSQQRLDDAVHALADPIPVWGGGTCRWSDSLYFRLRAALRWGGYPGGGGFAGAVLHARA